MWNDHQKGKPVKKRGKEGDLIYILDHYVPLFLPEKGFKCKRSHEIEIEAGASSYDSYSIDLFCRFTSREATAQKGDLVTLLGDSFEYLLKVNFRSPRLRIGEIFPV